MVLSAVGMRSPHDGVGSIGLVMSDTWSSDLVNPSRNSARAMANASSRQGQLSAWWRISSYFYLGLMPLAPAWPTCSATIGIADAPTTMVAGLGEDERVMKRLSWHGGLLK